MYKTFHDYVINITYLYIINKLSNYCRLQVYLVHYSILIKNNTTRY